MQRKHAIHARALALLGLLACVASIATGCSSGSSKPAHAQAPKSDFSAAGLLTPVRAAPPLSLRNSLGQRVNIASYRGKAVLVTFLYTHCPDVCPLIAANLRVAQNLMGPAKASKLQIVVVSVDPRGDTRKTVKTFLAQHQMTGRMQYLIGSAAELARVWKAWGVGSRRDAEHPDLVEHDGLIYGITGSGKRLTIYASNFQPSDIVHDVPLLAAR